MGTKDELLRDIKAFLKKNRMAKTTFGKLSVENPHIIDRLERGGRIYTCTADAMRAFMDAYTKREATKQGRPLGHIAAACL
jgi:hypothetical protein